MEQFSWLSLVPSVIGGLIGGTFAVIGMFVTGRRERRKSRDDLVRESVRRIGQCLLEIEDLYRSHIDPDRDNWEWGRETLTRDGSDKQERLLRELRMYAAAIPRDDIRSPLELVGRMIGHSGILAFTGDHKRISTHQLCRYGSEVITSYLNGAGLPGQPEFVKHYLAAIEEQERSWEEWEEERRKERQRSKDRSE